MPCKPKIPRSRPCSSRQAMQPLCVTGLMGPKHAADSGLLLRRFSTSASELSSCANDGGHSAPPYTTSYEVACCTGQLRADTGSQHRLLMLRRP